AVALGTQTDYSADGAHATTPRRVNWRCHDRSVCDRRHSGCGNAPAVIALPVSLGARSRANLDSATDWPSSRRNHNTARSPRYSMRWRLLTAATARSMATCGSHAWLAACG